MRLQFTDWKMEGGVLTERRADFGPLKYRVFRGSCWYGTCCGQNVDREGAYNSPSEAESACEAHLQAILDAAAALDAERTPNA